VDLRACPAGPGVSSRDRSFLGTSLFNFHAAAQFILKRPLAALNEIVLLIYRVKVSNDLSSGPMKRPSQQVVGTDGKFEA
jgi:hypothetical protein